MIFNSLFEIVKTIRYKTNFKRKYFKGEKENSQNNSDNISCMCCFAFLHFLNCHQLQFMFSLVLTLKPKLRGCFKILTSIIKGREDLKYVCAKRRRGSREDVGRVEGLDSLKISLALLGVGDQVKSLSLPKE